MTLRLPGPAAAQFPPELPLAVRLGRPAQRLQPVSAGAAGPAGDPERPGRLCTGGPGRVRALARGPIP